MQKINFQLTGQQTKIIQDAEFFLVKQSVTDKIYHLFGSLSEQYEQLFESLKALLPADFEPNRPKISRGENYRLQPYVMLDYPRQFKVDDTFAIRSLFWWGNEFSIHLLLSGSFLLAAGSTTRDKIKNILDDQWYFSFTDDPWEHHFMEGNYTPINEYEEREGKYFKLGKRLPLDQWMDAEEFFIDSFSKLIAIMQP